MAPGISQRLRKASLPRRSHSRSSAFIRGSHKLMCGFAGILASTADHSTEELRPDVSRPSADTLVHRGPDDAGGATRRGDRPRLPPPVDLDLSPPGHQPMHRHPAATSSPSTANLQLHREAIRALLEPRAHPRLAGSLGHRSPARGVEPWGIEAARQKIRTACSPSRCGTARERGCTCAATAWARNRSTTASANRTLLFGSELKALGAHHELRQRNRPQGAGAVLRYGYIPGAHSIYENIYKLDPGHDPEDSPRHRHAAGSEARIGRRRTSPRRRQHTATLRRLRHRRDRRARTACSARASPSR